MLKLSLSMTWRDWRAGELRLLLIALTLAVAALSAVQFFAARMGAVLERDTHQLLGADLRLAADAPIDRAWHREAAILGLMAADVIELQSMASAGEGDAARARLVSLKAVGQGYPLRGRLALHDGASIVAVHGIPAAGTAWVDPAVLASLHLRIGDPIELGDARLQITRTIATEPDRGPVAMMLAPRVLVSLPDLETSGLAQGRSLASWDLLLAGEPATLAAYEAWARARLKTVGGKGIRLETVASSSAATGEVLGRASTFLSLVGLLTAMLASLAVAMASRRFMLRHADACAMLRCLGMRHSRVMGLFLAEFALVGLAASLAGVALGFAAHLVLAEWLDPLFTGGVAPVSWAPAWRGLAVGVLLLAGFALPPLLQLRAIPSVRLLRQDRTAPAPRTLAGAAIGLATFAGLMLWQADNVSVGLITVGAFLIATLLFAAAARAALACLRFVPASCDRGVMRLALADLRRRPGAMTAQVVALALGLMTLLVMTVVRNELLDSWRRGATPDAPNHFIFNAQPDQKNALDARLRPYRGAALHPVMSGRLMARNGKPLDPARFADKRARRLLETAIDVSTAATLPPLNTLVAGRWFRRGSAEVSVSEISARALGLQLGDRIDIDFGGTMRSVTVTSFRQVDWRSGRPNFGFLIDPDSANGIATSYVAALRLPADSGGFVSQLVRDYPNLTIIDMDAMMRQFEGLLDQVSKAIEFLFLFTLAAGILVLGATLAATREERQRQAGILRALGASRTQLARAQSIEQALAGALAGLLAAAGASAASWAIARFALDLAWHFSPLLWLVAAAAGIACAVLATWTALRAVLATPPLHALRAH